MRNILVNNLVALIVSTPFIANASDNYNYFVGLDVGTRISGKLEQQRQYLTGSYEGVETSSYDLRAQPIVGLNSGVIINNNHRIKMSFVYDDIKPDNAPEGVDLGVISINYDYILPLFEKLSWTTGVHMGYEFAFDNDLNDIHGMIGGVQTGIDYKFTKNWSLGGEISLTTHEQQDLSSNYVYRTVRIEDDVALITNIQYHF
ncbi:MULTISPECIES: hypothetical protein [unclassified Vibrio]|uniref:hypothetical protein n=1 Tax=unclassified Vibrio TaxID=2614977 RepID=UPI001192A859|nr:MULTISPECIES: hypothetical protein [unclassified Vibrio]MCF7507172.1 hypothetical protein [Vibrio sp. L3-7]MDA0155901.1 hypothetical protein [Vibrio sp. Makdt]TVU67898.1 hypothetical protein FQP87_23485 [Vibrio tasmaniensis]CAH7052159.1 conserved exported hypothetical protein [Vibrio chagasii]